MVDPRAGPVTLTLKTSDLADRDPALVLKGRVLDDDGDPLPGAVVEPFGFQKGTGGQYGGLTGFDPLALTDDEY
jgi:protocatechuate 3,4-dioxygenase beta subunit